MLRKLCRRKTLLLGIFTSVDVEDEQIFKDFKKRKGLFIEDDWERVKIIFRKDDAGYLHPAMMNAWTAAQFGFIVGGFFGALHKSKLQTENFFYNNDATLFQGNKDAYKKLNRTTVLAGFQGAVRSGPLYSLLFGSFSLFSSCVQAYRNDVGIIESTIGGFGAGGLLRSHLGIRGFISGGVVGSLLGTIYGIVKFTVMKFTGVDPVALEYSQYAFSLYKQKKRLLQSDEIKDPLGKITAELETQLKDFEKDDVVEYGGSSGEREDEEGKKDKKMELKKEPKRLEKEVRENKKFSEKPEEDRERKVRSDAAE